MKHLITLEECNCFACKSKTAFKTARKNLDTLVAQAGFVPLDYEGINWEDVNQLITLDSKLDSVNAYNKEFLQIKTNSKSKLVFCCDCGRIDTYSVKKLILKQGNPRSTCRVCRKVKYRKCSSCGYLVSRGDFKNVPGTYSPVKKICTSCWEKTFFVCQHCRDVYSLSTVRREQFSSREGTTIVNLCPECAPNIRHCTDCGRSYFSRDTGNTCGSCFNSKYALRAYSFQPAPKWRHAKEDGRQRMDTLYFGVEWELEAAAYELSREKVIKKLSDSSPTGMLYFKSDGSLNHGIEVVTHPFTWQSFRESRKIWEILIQTAVDNRMIANKNCGIHVHMSKSAFTHAHLYKFSSFILSRANRKFIVDISERGGENQFAAFIIDDYKPKGLVRLGLLKQNPSGKRHVAVNCTKKDTIEVRIFQSTTKVENFFKNLEFCQALFEFSNEFGFKDMKVEKFKNWVFKHRNEYRNLVLFMEGIK